MDRAQQKPGRKATAMRAVKENFIPAMTWLGCLAFAFATLTETRRYSRSEPGVLLSVAQASGKSLMAAQAAYDPGGDLPHASRR